MKTVFCMLLLTVLPAPLACARESLDKSALGLCSIDSKPIKKDLHVDWVGLRRYACSGECLEKIKSMGSALERRAGKQHPPGMCCKSGCCHAIAGIPVYSVFHRDAHGGIRGLQWSQSGTL